MLRDEHKAVKNLEERVFDAEHEAAVVKVVLGVADGAAQRRRGDHRGELLQREGVVLLEQSDRARVVGGRAVHALPLACAKLGGLGGAHRRWIHRRGRGKGGFRLRLAVCHHRCTLYRRRHEGSRANAAQTACRDGTSVMRARREHFGASPIQLLIYPGFTPVPPGPEQRTSSVPFLSTIRRSQLS
jgi:hypothetical protein